MCGIAGFYSKDNVFSKEELINMTEILAHRGPDAEGYFTDDTVSLGHRRLSILDLSERANQPIHSHDGRYVIIYNGEVYNFQEIAANLKSTTPLQPTLNFSTSSDTEVILEAFVQQGVDFVQQLNGMFALAIYDKVQKELYLFRDRVGIKPLYYFWDGNNFAFASEMKSLLQLKFIPREINKSAIRDFLHFGYVPTPISIYKHIHKMRAGSWIKISKNKFEEQKYWTINSKLQHQTIKNKEQAMVKLSDLIISSVQYQLKSDVPFGVFLSGGIDSSLVTAQAVLLSGIKVNTFSIGFEENSHNESEYAKAIAKYLGTEHHEFIVSYRDAINLVDSIFDVYDEPFADSSAIPTMMVSKLAKQYVSVTLTGEGGDELFFGYGAYKWAKRLQNPMIKAFRKPIGNTLSHLSSRYKRAAHQFLYDDPSKIKSHIFSQEQYLFADYELNALLTPDYYAESSVPESQLMDSFLRIPDDIFTSNIHQKERHLTPMEMQALFDIEYYLKDDLLTKVDRASMRYSLETRVPYLDHRIVEFALNIDPSLKYRNGVTKYILRQILYNYIPEKFFARPKQGFAIPLNIWLTKELGWLITDYLSREVIERYGVVNYKEVERIKKEFYNGNNYLYNRIWLLIVLHKWLIKNIP
ncbi:MAG: asparagine synthase (glutamine-hydrolyzing) [Bacteroidota bacterium]